MFWKNETLTNLRTMEQASWFSKKGMMIARWMMMKLQEFTWTSRLGCQNSHTETVQRHGGDGNVNQTAIMRTNKPYSNFSVRFCGEKWKHQTVVFMGQHSGTSLLRHFEYPVTSHLNFLFTVQEQICQHWGPSWQFEADCAGRWMLYPCPTNHCQTSFSE